MQQTISTNPEVHLLRSAREGNLAASAQLFEAYLAQSPSILKLLRQTVRNPEDRQELLHEIYLQLITGSNVFRGEARLSTYVYRVARMTVFQKFRRENALKRGKIYRMISEPVEVPAGENAGPDYTYSLKEAWEILMDLIRKMPDLYRKPLFMRVFDDLSYLDIARTLNVPVNTVSTRIHKGKRMLTRQLAERGIRM